MDSWRVRILLAILTDRVREVGSGCEETAWIANLSDDVGVAGSDAEFLLDTRDLFVLEPR